MKETTIKDFFNNYDLEVRFVNPRRGDSNKSGIRWLNTFTQKKKLSESERMIFHVDKVNTPVTNDYCLKNFNTINAGTDEYDRFFNRLNKVCGVDYVEVHNVDRAFNFITNVLGVTI